MAKHDHAAHRREWEIRKELTAGQYSQLVKDLRAAQRAFDLLAKVAPDVLHRMRRARVTRDGTDIVADAHHAIDQLVREVRHWRMARVTAVPRPRLSLVRRKR